MGRAAPLMVAGLLVATLGFASAQTPAPTHIVEASDLMCVSWEQVSRGPASIFLQNAAIQIVEDKRPVDILIVEEQRIDDGVPIVVFRAERQDRRMAFVWKGGPLIERPDHHAEMICGTLDTVPLASDGSADSERMVRDIYMPPLDRDARYMLGYSAHVDAYTLLQIKGEGVDLVRQLPMTPSNSLDIQMFGDMPASQQ
jgi:hypothetical protein